MREGKCTKPNVNRSANNIINKKEVINMIN